VQQGRVAVQDVTELGRCLRLCKSREVLVEQFVVGMDNVCCCLVRDGELVV